MGKNTTIGGALLCLVGLCGLVTLSGGEPEVLPVALAPTADEDAPAPAPAAAELPAAPAAAPPMPLAEMRTASGPGPRTLVRVAVGTEAREFFDPLWEAAVERALPHLDVMVAVAGNRDVLDQLRQERVDLAAVHGELSWRERESGLTEQELGRERFVLVVREGHQPWELGREQLHAILTGKATDWLAVGGGSMPLRVVIPSEAGFLARAASTLVPGDPLAEGCVRVVDEAAVLERVRNDAGCIGIVRAPALVDAAGIKAVRIEGFDLATARMQAGSCRAGERVLLVTHEATSTAGREVAAFLTSPGGRALLRHSLVVD